VRYAMSGTLADALDFSTFRAEPTHWVSNRMKHTRSSDSVFSLRFKTGEPVFLILMLEFQSKPDSYMAVRSSLYTLLFYESLAKKKNHPLMVEGQLPAVLPIVLYSGKAQWNAPTGLLDLIALPPAHFLARYQPKQHFFLINEKEIKDKMKASFTQALFKLEFIQDQSEFEDFLSDLIPFLKRASISRRAILKGVFSAYLGGLLSESGYKVSESTLIQLLESQSMLAENLKKVFKQKERAYIKQGEIMGLKKGKQIGITEGLEKGKLEAKKATLRNLLQKKFNVVLSEAINQKIEAADIDTLDLWIENIFDAKSIEGLLRLAC